VAQDVDVSRWARTGRGAQQDHPRRAVTVSQGVRRAVIEPVVAGHDLGPASAAAAVLAAVVQVAAVSQDGAEHRLAVVDVEGFAEGLDRGPRRTGH